MAKTASSWIREKKNLQFIKYAKELNQSGVFKYLYINPTKLKAKASVGEVGKIAVKITLDPSTLQRTMQIVEYGKGKYTSSYLNLALKLLNELFTEGNDLERIAMALNDTTIKPTLLYNNVARLASILVPKEETF